MSDSVVVLNTELVNKQPKLFTPRTHEVYNVTNTVFKNRCAWDESIQCSNHCIIFKGFCDDENFRLSVSELCTNLCDIIIEYDNVLDLSVAFINEVSKYDAQVISTALWHNHNVSYTFNCGVNTTNDCIFAFLIKNTNFIPLDIVKYIYEELDVPNNKQYLDNLALQLMYGFNGASKTNELTYYLLDKLLCYNFNFMLDYTYYTTKTLLSIYTFAITSNYLNNNNENILHIFCKYKTYDTWMRTFLIEITTAFKTDADEILTKLVNSADKNGDRPIDVVIRTGDIRHILMFFHLFFKYITEISDRGLCIIWLIYDIDIFLNYIQKIYKPTTKSCIMNYIKRPLRQFENLSLFDLMMNLDMGRKVITSKSKLQSFNFMLLKLKDKIELYDDINLSTFMLTEAKEQYLGIYEVMKYYDLYVYCLDAMETQILLERMFTPEIALKIISKTPEFRNFVISVQSVLPKIVGNIKVNLHTLLERVFYALTSMDKFTFECSRCGSCMLFGNKVIGTCSVVACDVMYTFLGLDRSRSNCVIN